MGDFLLATNSTEHPLWALLFICFIMANIQEKALCVDQFTERELYV